MEDSADLDKCLRNLNDKKQLCCPSCKNGLVCYGESIDQHVEIMDAADINGPIEGIIRLRHKKCKKSKMLTICLICNRRTCESVRVLVRRYCECGRTPTKKAAANRSNTTELPPDNVATNSTINDDDSCLWNDNDAGLYQPDGGTAINLEEPDMDAGVGDAPWHDGDKFDLCNNGDAVEVVITDPELEAQRVFANTSEFPEQSGEFLTREFIKKGDGCRAMVYSTKQSSTIGGSQTSRTWKRKKWITTFT